MFGLCYGENLVELIAVLDLLSLGSQSMLSCPISSWMYLFGPKREIGTKDLLKSGSHQKTIGFKVKGLDDII